MNRNRATLVGILALLLMSSRARAADAPFDLIQRAYAPYMTADDPLAFPMKVRSIAADPYKFWRGSKDLFFIWCRTNTSDWLADTGAFQPTHGDLHLGNIGSYPSDEAWAKLAFGMVDFDDSSNLPFQIELLQGLITLKLTARQNNVALDTAAGDKLLQTMLDSYRLAVNSQRNATRLLLDAQDPTLSKLLRRQQTPYIEELNDYTAGGKFKPAIYSAKGKLKDILRPAMDRANAFTAALSSAMKNEPDMARLFRPETATSIRKSIKDIVQRTRLDSSGSQGLKKYLLLLEKPLRASDQYAIIYLKQEIPSAAERSGIVPRQSRSPGQRVKQDMDRLTEPAPYMNSWCEIDGESYWVTFKEPWSDELSPDDVKSYDELLHTARIWGVVTGAAHREDGRFESILPRLKDNSLAKVLNERTDSFIQRLDSDFARFRADPRVAEIVHRADAAIQPLLTH